MLVYVYSVERHNISAISWWSVLLVEETEVSGENHKPAGPSFFNDTYLTKKQQIHIYLPLV